MLNRVSHILLVPLPASLQHGHGIAELLVFSSPLQGSKQASSTGSSQCSNFGGLTLGETSSALLKAKANDNHGAEAVICKR